MHPVQRGHAPGHEQPGHLLVGRDHQVLDHPVRFGVLDRLGGDHVPTGVELELGLGRVERQRPLRGPALLERSRGRTRDLERRPPVARRAVRTGKDAIDLPVVQALVRADHRAVERAAANPRAFEHELGRDREAVLPGHKRARPVRERLGQHRLDRARDVHAGPAPVGLAVEQRARPHVFGHVGDVDPHPPRAIPLVRGRDRIVEVTGGDRVDRERRQRAQIAPIGRGRRW